MTKIHFRPYTPNQTVLFLQRIDEYIAENDPVRMVDALVENLNLESFRKLYKECGQMGLYPTSTNTEDIVPFIMILFLLIYITDPAEI